MRCIGTGLFLLIALSAFAAERTVRLTAEQANGGVLVTFKDGSKGVALDRSCEAGGKKPIMEWKLDEPLAPGWWRGVVEFGPREGEDKYYVNRCLGLVAAGGREPLVDLMVNYHADEKAKPPHRFTCWFFISEPAPAVRLVPVYSDLWRYKRTWPVKEVTMEAATLPSLNAEEAVTLDLAVGQDGTTPLPCALPPGNWSLRGAMTKEGTAKLQMDDGRNIEAPFSFDRWHRPSLIWFYAEKPVRQVKFKTSMMIKATVLSHLAASVQPSIATPGAPMTVVDSAKTEAATLELIGSSLTGEPPRFGLLPAGKKTVVVTTWDDGALTDMRLAELMKKHGYHPSFFLNQNSPMMKSLDKLEALGVEIGSHCYHHPSLYQLSPQPAEEECVEMRKLLETELKHPVISLAHPNGYTAAYDTEGDYVLRALRKAGYWNGRTTLGAVQQTVETLGDLLALKTDGFFGDQKGLERAWDETRKKEGGVFLFWGHSWQIGKTDEQWQSFENFIAKFANQPDVWYASQGELSLWVWARQNVKITVTEKSPAKVVVKLSRTWLHPYLAARCPWSLRLPDGVTRVLWRGKEVPAAKGFVELIWSESSSSSK